VRYAWNIVTGPVEEPISIAEIKAQARVTHDREDALLYSYIVAAREAAESYLSRGLLTQTWRMDLEYWPDVVSLPMAAPLQNDALASPSTAVAVQYYNSTGVLTTLATTYYAVDTTSTPGQVVRAPLQSWPTLQSDRSLSVVITYVVGWTAPDLVPETIKQGIRLLAASMPRPRDTAVDMDAVTRAAQACWDRAGCLSHIPPDCYASR